MLEEATLAHPRPSSPPATATATVRLAAWQRDLLWVLLATLACFALASAFELHEAFYGWLARYERWQADELPLTFTVLATALAWFATRRRREALAELQRRVEAETRATALLAHNRELARQLITLQESERMALARELHDELGQGCSAIRVETAFIRHCPPEDHKAVRAAAHRADAAAQALYQQVRDLLRRLRPANLDTLGLVASVQALCAAWQQRSGVPCIFTFEGMSQPLGEAVDIAIYRVAQEALTNVLRHAKADSVRMVLARSDAAEVRLSVQDSGRGMDLNAATRGLGLLGARERAAALGGELSLKSRPGEGLLLQLRIPLVTQAAPAPPSAQAGA